MMQAGLRLRDRPEKKERDRESLNQSKRRRSERFAVKNERDAVEAISDESLSDGDIPISQNSASFQQNYLRKGFPPARVPRHAPAKTGLGPSLKVADEMIGVPVPRKARSACIKRAHDCRTSSGSGGGGFGNDHRRPPASPASYSFEAASPSSSAVSVKQKNACESKSHVPKPLKSSGMTEDDLEFEIAEVLSGLKKQPRSSKKEEDSVNSLKSSEFKASKKMKMEAGDSSAHVENGSITCTVGIETGRSGNIEISMDEKSSGLNPLSHRTAGFKAAETSSAAMDTQNETQKQEQSGNPDGVTERRRSDSQDSTVTKGVSKGPQSKSGREESDASNKLEINLMVHPTTPSSPERDPLPLAFGPKTIENYKKLASSQKRKEKFFGNKDTINLDWLKLDLEKPSQDNAGDSSLRLQNPGQSQLQQANSAQRSSVFPLLPPVGYVPQLHTFKPVDGITESSPKMPTAPFAASQPRPKRCATHFFVAQNIQLHQQFAKTNHVWVPNPCSVHLNSGGSMPNHLYVIPPTSAEGLINENPSVRSSFPVLKLNSLAQDEETITANIPTQKDKAFENGRSTETAQQKPRLPAASSNLEPTPAFIFPANHHQRPIMGAANQSVPSKSSGPTKNPSLASGSTSVSFCCPSTSSSEASPYLTFLSNNGYSFQMSTPPAVRGKAPSQALPFFNGSLYSPQIFQPPQGQAHKETSTSSGSSSSRRQHHPQVGVSSRLNLANEQKQHLQLNAQQSQKPETKKSVDNSSSVSDCWGSHTQKSSYSQNMSVPVQPFNFSMSFASFGGSGAPTSLNFASNGYHIAQAPQGAQQKNQQPSDAKSRDCSILMEDPKKAIIGKAPPCKSGQTLVFGNSSRTLNFVSSSWPSPAVTATTMNSSSLASTQKHHMQQQQSGRGKLINGNTLPATSLAAKFPSSVIVFPQTPTQANPGPSKSSQWKNPEIPSPFTSCTSSNLKQLQSEQQMRTQGQTQISFAAAPKLASVQPSQGQQEKPGSCHPQYQASPVAGSAPHGKTNSTVSNIAGSPSTIPATWAQSQQHMENPAPGSSQKSSPVCGRSMTSIISSCSGKKVRGSGFKATLLENERTA